jgi:hypothetical protein
MHPVHDSIGSWTEIRGTLEEKGDDVEKFFPAFLHRKHPVCGITMMKESLCKQGEIPMCTQYSQYPHSFDFYGKYKRAGKDTQKTGRLPISLAYPIR